MTFVPRHDIDLVHLHGALELDLWRFGQQALAPARRHGLDVVLIQTEFVGDLTVGEIEAHEIQAQNPDAERLMTASQDRPGQIVEAAAAPLATVALPVLLGVVNAVADDGTTGTAGAADAVGPTVLTDQFVALRLVDEGGEIDQFGRVHDDTDGLRDSPHRINRFAS
jgi:hypothetical protein